MTELLRCPICHGNHWLAFENKPGRVQCEKCGEWYDVPLHMENPNPFEERNEEWIPPMTLPAGDF